MLLLTSRVRKFNSVKWNTIAAWFRTIKITAIINRTNHVNAAQHAKALKEIPGNLTNVPFIGALFSAYYNYANAQRRYEYMFENFVKYGPIFKVRLGKQYYVHVCDVNAIAELCRHEGDFPQRTVIELWRSWREENGHEKGVLIEYGGESWKKMRSALDHRLLQHSNLATFSECVNNVAIDAAERFGRARDNDGILPNLEHELFKWSLEAVGSVLYERRFGGLDDVYPDDHEQFIRNIQQIFRSTLTAPFISRHLAKKILPAVLAQHDQAWEFVFNKGKAMVDERIEELKRLRKDKQKIIGLMFDLLDHRSMTVPQLYANLCELMLAAVQMTSVAMLWTLYELSRRSDIQEAILKEVKAVVADTNKPTYEELRSLSLVNGVIKETLRLYPPTTVLTRIAVEDIVLCGYRIPAMTMIFPNASVIGRNPDLFADPDSFQPGRWIEGREQGKINPLAYLPFGQGSRGCLGRLLAELEMATLIIQVVKNFRLELSSSERIVPKLEGLLMPDKLPNIRFVDRNTS